MRLLRNNSASAYSVCVYTETLGVFWRAWFSHSLLPCPFSSDYKSRWLQQFELKRIHFLLIQNVLRSPLTRAWPEFDRRAENETKPGPAEQVLSWRIKHGKGSGEEAAIRWVPMKHTDAFCTRSLSSQMLWCVWKDACHSVCSLQTHLPDPNPRIHSTNPPLNPKY